MAQIDTIVQLNISRQTSRLETEAFDIPLILVDMDETDVIKFTDRVRQYTSIEGVITDLGDNHDAVKMAQALLSGDTYPNTFMVGKVDRSVEGSEETYLQGYNAVVDANDDFYAVLTNTRLATDIEALSDRIQAQRKAFFTASSEPDAFNAAITTDIGPVLKDKGNSHTYIMYSPKADVEYPEASWVGSQIVKVPGSNTWAFKRLAGASVYSLTDTQIATLKSKGYQYYIRVKGAPITQIGASVDGKWTDENILIDWIYARIQERIFYRLINVDKIPLTQEGATIIEGDIRSVLSEAQTNGGVASYTVTSPVVSAIPAIQKADRILGDFKFTAILAGAVHTIKIEGVATV